MRIDGQAVEVEQGYPTLILQTEIGEMRIGLEQKLAGRGLIHVDGPLGAGLPPVRLPADKGNGQGPLTLRGFTRDKAVMAAYEVFRAEHE